MRCETHEPFIQRDEKHGGGRLACMRMVAVSVYFT